MGIDIGAWFAKWGLIVIVSIALIISAVVAFKIHEHQVVQNAVAPVKAQAAVSAADAQSGHDAVNITAKNAKESDQTDTTTRNNHAVIIQLPGAKVTLDPALDAAGRRAICMRPSAAGLPECQSLLQPDPK